jgi:HK97 family phage major capsid protein
MSISRAQQLRREKAGLAEKMLAIGAKAQAESRLMTSEEHEEVARIDADIKAHDTDIAACERMEALRVETAGSQGTRAGQGDAAPPSDAPSAPKAADAYAAAFGRYLRGGYKALSGDQQVALEANRFNVNVAELPPEARELVQAAMGTGVDVVGGFTLPPEKARGVIEAQKTYGGMRRSRAEVISTSHGRDIPWITDDDTSNEGRLIGENKPATGGTEPQFGIRNLSAYIYTSDYVRVSFSLLQDGEFDLESMLNRKFAERIGRITERHFATGDGAGKPEGITIGAKLGQAGATGQTTSVKDTDFTNLYHSLDPAHRENGEWMLHDSTLLGAKLLKDGNGRPLWRSGLAVREPDTIEDKPYIVNNSMPTMAASAKSILFGDFSYYKIRDVTPPMVLRLTEKFIEYGQVAFLMFSRHDGKLIYGANTANATALCPVKYYQNSAS